MDLLNPLLLIAIILIMFDRRLAYKHSDHESHNTDRNMTCEICGRYPEIWEDAFPVSICEGCYEDLLERQDFKELKGE